MKEGRKGRKEERNENQNLVRLSSDTQLKKSKIANPGSNRGVSYRRNWEREGREKKNKVFLHSHVGNIYRRSNSKMKI